MIATPLISVLMTAYNREKYIAAAIESVIASSYTNFELIIVDDGSTDNTLNIAQSFQEIDTRIVVYKNEINLGDYFNRNKAAFYAKGKYIKYLDSDDIIYPYSLHIMVGDMENNPDINLGLCDQSVQHDMAPFPVKFTSEQAYYHHFFKGGLLFTGPSGSIIRKDYFDLVGGFSGKRYVSDTELWLKIVQNSPVLMLQPALIWWRRHEGQEFNLGHINEEYVQLNFELNKTYLESKDCPLQVKDRKKAVRNYKNRLSRKIIRKIVHLKFSDADRMKKYAKINTATVLASIIPANKINKVLNRSLDKL